MTEPTGKKAQAISLPVPEELARSAEFVGKELGWDSSELLLHWLRTGAEREMLQLVSDGELSTGKFVELLGITYYHVHPMTQKYNIAIGPTEEQLKYMRDRHADAVGAILEQSTRPQQEQQD